VLATVLLILMEMIVSHTRISLVGVDSTIQTLSKQAQCAVRVVVVKPLVMMTVVMITMVALMRMPKLWFKLLLMLQLMLKP